MKKIVTESAPKAIGPYSQAILVPTNSQLVFVSGQLPIDPLSGKLVVGDIKILASKVIDNIEAILEEAGSGLDQVIRTEIFLTNLKDFAQVNEVYAQRFQGPSLPARQTVQVAALPMGSPIEISCIAIL